MLEWIDDHLRNDNGIVSRRCTSSWFRNNGHEKALRRIAESTQFLSDDSSVAQRVWHITEGVGPVTCGSASCSRTPTFRSMSKGYSDYCGQRCAQSADEVQRRIEETNRERYGAARPIAADTVVREKAQRTIQERYGVENASQADEVKSKKRQTCLRNFGTAWPMEAPAVRQRAVETCLERYDARNPMQAQHIAERSSDARIERSAKRLLRSDRLNDIVTPLFEEGEYRGIRHGYLFRCKRCGDHFFDNLRKGEVPRCRACYPTQRSSRQQAEIARFLDSCGVRVRQNVQVGGVEVDVYAPSVNLAVEHDGLYWHGERRSGRGKSYHLGKTEACLDVGVTLLHVFEDEWMNRRTAVRDRLRYRLGVAERGPGARTCTKQRVDASTANAFLDDNHLQGADNAPHAYTLRDTDGDTVAVLTARAPGGFGGSADADVEVSRFCTDGRSIAGAFGRLFALMLGDLGPDRVVTFCDRRWSPESGFYENMGFDRVGVTGPGYWYVKSGRRYHRYGFRKSALEDRLDRFDPSLTEWQNMQIAGYDRVWDCGHFRYVWERD